MNRLWSLNLKAQLHKYRGVPPLSTEPSQQFTVSSHFLRPGGGSDRLWLLRTTRHTSTPALPTLSCLSGDRYVYKTLPRAGLFPGARSCAFKSLTTDTRRVRVKGHWSDPVRESQDWSLCLSLSGLASYHLATKAVHRDVENLCDRGRDGLIDRYTDRDRDRQFVCLFVCLLLNVPATC